jgi:hypothetical protein
MIVEPIANEKVEDNLNSVRRIYYSASTMICTPASRAQEVPSNGAFRLAIHDRAKLSCLEASKPSEDQPKHSSTEFSKRNHNLRRVGCGPRTTGYVCENSVSL